MSAHTKLHNKGDFDKALETKGKYVLIHAHAGAVMDKADEYVYFVSYPAIADKVLLQVRDKVQGHLRRILSRCRGRAKD